MTNYWTNQTAFDKMVSHLQQMPGRSTRRSVRGTRDYDYCVYLAEDGNKCPVGALMTEEEAVLGGEGVASIYSSRPSLQGVDVALLRQFQLLHDCIFNWKDNKFQEWDRVAKIGEKFHLDVSRVPKENHD